MDNCLTPKKAIAKLTSLTGIKWTQWHGKSTAIKRCVVTLTPVTPHNITSSRQYFVPVGKPPGTDTEMFVKTYIKPKYNQLAILPGVRFDFIDTEVILPPKFSGDSLVKGSIFLNGNLLIQPHTSANNAKSEIRNLRTIGVRTGLMRDDFMQSFAIADVDILRSELSIGNSISGENWNASVHISGNKITGQFEQQVVNIKTGNFVITGNVGFGFEGEYYNKPSSPMPKIGYQYDTINEYNIVRTRDVSTQDIIDAAEIGLGVAAIFVYFVFVRGPGMILT